jgi:tetratricopeptide (TPR) repeat protein
VNALVPILAVAATAAVPVEFNRRSYETIRMKDGTIHKGRIISGPDDPNVRVQLARRQKLLARDLIDEIIPPESLEEAHDRVAAGIPHDDPDSWHAIALECLKKRPPLYEKAVGDLGLAIGARRTHGPSHLLLTRVLLRMGDVRGAREAAEHFRRALPHSPEAHLAMGEVLVALGEDPRDAFRAAIKLEPTVDVYLGLAQAEVSRGRFDEAEKALASARRLSPRSIEVEAARGDLALARGRLDEAEAVYATALKRARGVRKARGLDSARLGLASACYLQGRFDEATEALLDANPIDTHVTYVLGLVKLARELAAPKRRRPERDEATDEADELRPPSESERLFALAAEDGLARGHLGLGTAAFLASDGDFSAALPHFEKAARTDRGDAYAALLTAWAKLRLGRAAEAVPDYMHVTVLAPGFAEGHAALAASTLAAGSKVEAVRLYSAGLDSCPDDPRLLAGLGLAQVAAGDAMSAKVSLERARRAGYRGPDLYLGLGYLAHLAGDNASAADWYTWALSAASWDRSAGTAAEYVRESLPKLYSETGLAPTIFTFDENGEPADPLGVEAHAGPETMTEGGRLLISGEQTGDDGKRTSILLPVDGALFRSVAADFDLGMPASTTTAGLRLSSHTGAVEIAGGPEAGVRVRFRDGQKASFQEWRGLMEWPLSEDGRLGRVRLTISMIESGKNLARVELRVRASPPGGSESPATRVIELHEAFWRERAYSVRLFAAAPTDEMVNAAIDNLVLVERARE